MSILNFTENPSRIAIDASFQQRVSQHDHGKKKKVPKKEMQGLTPLEGHKREDTGR